jgi:hypothetical protein
MSLFNKNELLPTFSDDVHYNAIPIKELFKAVDHLYKSISLIEPVMDFVFDGAYDALVCSEKLKTAWLEINCCRLYTEKDVNFEEMLQPALGYTSDAKSMIDSLAHWNMALTRHAKFNILNCLDAARKLVGLALEALEGMSNAGIKNSRCNRCNRIYLIGDKYCSQCGNKI